MHLVRDILDKEVTDRHEQKIGRVDGIVLELRAGAPPRAAFLVMGGTTLPRRLSPRLARWAGALRRAWGPRAVEPTRIPWAAFHRSGASLTADVDAADVAVLAWERWLRDHVVARIPGGGS